MNQFFYKVVTGMAINLIAFAIFYVVDIVTVEDDSTVGGMAQENAIKAK